MDVFVRQVPAAQQKGPPGCGGLGFQCVFLIIAYVSPSPGGVRGDDGDDDAG
jgi:hypothetical protein